MPTHPPLITAKNLRRAIGFIGIALPIGLVVGSLVLGTCTTYLKSLSIYYHTIVRNLFVGSLSTVAFALIIYRGYERIDNLITSAAGAMAICIAFFPANPAPEESDGCVRELLEVRPWEDVVHFVTAVVFFLLITFLCFRLFTKTDQPHPTPEKLQRNTVYRVCSYVMVGCLIILFLHFRTSWLDFLAPIRPGFVFETIALWAFGTAWLVKGELILADKLPSP